VVARYKALTLFKIIAVSLILVAFLSGCGTAGNAADSQGEANIESDNESEIKIGPLPGYMAPDFELEDLAGQKIRLSDLRGKIVILNFWSMTCRYCLQSLPEFDEYNRSRPEDVEVITVNLDTDDDRMPPYIQNQGFTFTVLRDVRLEVASNYLIYGLPATFIINKDGMVSLRIEGALYKEHLDSFIDEVRQKS